MTNGWDRQLLPEAEDLALLLLSFNLRIPILLSPITEDLDWNGGFLGTVLCRGDWEEGILLINQSITL
jgi:hypothetical protein